MKKYILEFNEDIQGILRRYFLRSVDFGENFEIFFVSAVLAVLGLRIWLKFVNYFIFGVGNIHIAHMLWGGALMLLATVISITFLGRQTKRVVALLGGLGFGVFIDELGKFVTSDNNYFYQPTFSIIYIIFVLIYLIFRAIQGKQNYNQKEYLANGIEYIEEAINNEMDVEEKEAALKFLLKADQKNPITKALINLCNDLETIPKKKPDILTRLKNNFSNYYFSLIKRNWFQDLVNGIFIFHLFLDVFFIGRYVEGEKESLTQLLNIFANVGVGIFIVWGIFKMRHSRLEAYQKFKASLLISIFFVQVFTFYNEQLRAFLGLILNILVLTALNYMIAQERNINKEV